MDSSLPLPSSAEDGPLLSVTNTYGSMLLGTVASIGFFGILTLQCYFYFINYPKDRPFWKVVVAVVWIVEFLRECFSVHAVYYYLVLKWGNVFALDQIIWSLSIILVFTAILQLILHVCFMYRVWILSDGKVWLVSIIGATALACFVFTIALFTVTVIVAHFSNLTSESGISQLVFPFSTAALSCAVAADWIITISLSVYIWPAGSLSSLRRPGSTVLFKRIVFILVNLGLLTSLGDIGVIILENMPQHTNTLWYYSFYTVVGTFYANSLVATLNARSALTISNTTVHLTSYITPSTFGEGNGPTFRHTIDDLELGERNELSDSPGSSAFSTRRAIGLSESSKAQ